jgi:hypothetical protein
MKYAPQKLTTAQQMLIAMGLDSDRLIQHHVGKSESNTKAGSGRVHRQGRELDAKGKPMPKSLKQLGAGSYGRGLRNARDRKNRDAIEARRAKAMAKSGFKA